MSLPRPRCSARCGPCTRRLQASRPASSGAWEKSRTFCGVCGTRMERSKTERALVCPVCGQLEYPKISPAVIIAITNGDKLLMSKYAGRRRLQRLCPDRRIRGDRRDPSRTRCAGRSWRKWDSRLRTSATTRASPGRSRTR